jgi:hypothetical protein
MAAGSGGQHKVKIFREARVIVATGFLFSIFLCFGFLVLCQ